MNKLISAKQLTIRQFSVVAVAIIVIHFSVFIFTTNDMENTFVGNRLHQVYDFAQGQFDNNYIQQFNDMELLTQGKMPLDNRVRVLFDFTRLPANFPDVTALAYQQVFEVESEESVNDLFVMKVKFERGGQTQDALLVIDNGIYDLSENQLFTVHSKQVIISVVLILFSLLVVIKISERLTAPIANFSNTLARRDPSDLTPLTLSGGGKILELEELVNTFNVYLGQIEQLIERERSFSRYASHELRSPLMVIQGAITLLQESQEQAFTERQIERLRKASTEMSEFVETLLSLTKVINRDNVERIKLDQERLIDIADNYQHLLEGKAVEFKIEISGEPTIIMAEAALHILLGNLIKNAFAYTEQGSVTISANPEAIHVVDTGKGFDGNEQGFDGFGLGLLLVRDICRQFGYQFDLRCNDGVGSTAVIQLS